MQTPIFGAWTVEVLGVQTVSFHGDVYFQLQVQHPDSPTPVTIRLPRHATAGAEPKVGQKLTLQFLMGQVTSAKPA